MRRKKVILAIVFVAIVVLLAGTSFLLDANRYRGEIQARLEEYLRRKVTLGDMSLRLFPVRIAVTDIAIAEDPNYESLFPFIQAARLDVRVRLLSLVQGCIEIDSIDLSGPRVELIRNADGVWNFSSLSRPSLHAPAMTSYLPPLDVSVIAAPPSDSKASPPLLLPPGPAKPPSGIALKKLAIRDGQVGLTDLFRKRTREVYDHIDISALDFSPGRPFSLEMAVHIPGPAGQIARLSGIAGPFPAAGLASIPLRAAITFQEINISGMREFFGTEYLPTTEGLLSGKTQIESRSGRMEVTGQFGLNRGRIGDIQIGYPVRFDYKLASEPATGVLQIVSATLHLGQTPVSVIGSINTLLNPIEVDLRARLADASIAEVARLASAFGIAFSPVASVAGRLSGDVVARGPIDGLALDGGISGRDLEISGKGIPQAVRVPVLDLSLTPSGIRSNAFEARSGKTTVIGRVALRRYASKEPVVDVALRTPGATLPEVKAIARAFGLATLEQLSGAGRLDFNLRASWPLDAVASTGIVQALNGRIALNFDTLKVQGFDAVYELSRIGGFLRAGDVRDGFTTILRLAGHIAVRNGVAETDDLEVRLAEGTLAISGKSDLAAETLDLRATAMFSKAFSEKLSGTAAGGYLKTALANTAGELVIPAIISGKFRNPKFAPDMRAIFQAQTEKMLLGPDK